MAKCKYPLEPSEIDPIVKALKANKKPEFASASD